MDNTMLINRIAFSFSICATIGGVVFSLAPALMVIKVRKTKDASQASEYVFICSCFNCVSLIVNFSRIRPLDYPVLLNNIFGTICNFTYFAIFCAYKYQKVKKYLLIFLSPVVLAGFGLLLGFGWKNEVNGWVFMVLNILMYGSSLQKLVVVLKTRQYQLLPLPLSIITLYLGCCWTVYAVCKNYIYVTVPSVLAIAFGVTGIIVFFVVKHKAEKSVVAQPADISAIKEIINSTDFKCTLESKQDHDADNRTATLKICL